MRGGNLLKEPSSSSICAFCAHRLGPARRPSHVQRRYFQSSRSTSKPPAAAEALREKSEGTPQSQQAGPSWGSPGAAPTWGRQPPIPLSKAPAWSKEEEGHSQVPSKQPDRWNAMSEAEDLLPHELRARELIHDGQRRKVTMHSGPGPQSSRAGRPSPENYTRSQHARLEIAREALEIRKARERTAATDLSRPPLIRRMIDTKHVMGDIEPQTATPEASTEWKEAPKWTQLRRRGEDLAVTPAPAPVQSESQRDLFVVGRARREDESKSAKYTPLGSKFAINHTKRDSPQRTLPQLKGGLELREPDTPDRWTRPDSDGSRSIYKPHLDSPSTQASGSNRSGVGIGDGSEPRFTISRIGAFEPPPGSSRTEQSHQNDRQQADHEAQEEKSRLEYEERFKKLPARFAAAKPDYAAMPKGKGRDKAKRRQQFMEEDEEDEERLLERQRRVELKKQRKLAKEAKKAAAPVPILLPEFISVSNLAMALKVRVETFIEKLEELGYEEMTTDYVLSAEDSGLIAMEYNFEAIIDRSESEDLKAREPAVDPSILPQRPPVVTIMGHVDHGKTTLLDWLRKSSVAATEHGGITQHIGAFSVPMPSGKLITFLDTPGHAAFLSMRQRGANVTDIVILVVAADDSVKPQTIEAIKHAQTAKVPIIVAINKVDKEDANIDRVKQDLARHGVDVEDFGGDTQVVCVSGKTGQGMGELEEAAVTLSEILDMRAETDGQAEGWVLEASIKSMGKVATVLVRRGTVRPGDFIVAGKTWARIRCLRNEAGVEIESAGPGTPVEIDGWREQPEAGDEVLQAPDEGKAKSVVDYRLEKAERDKMAEDMEAINEHRKTEQEKREKEKEEARLEAEAKAADEDYVPGMDDKKPNGPKEVYFIIKGDVSGSVEAVRDSISSLGNKEVQPHILRYGVGQLSEFDIEHAAAAKGHLINFNTPLEPHIAALAEKHKVTIIDHNIIYRLVDDVRAELSKHLPPLITQRVLGEAEIAQIFDITVKGRQQKNIAGCKVRNGTIARNAKVRVLRNNEKVFDGSLASLKNVKKDVQEMKKGTECGMGFDGWFDFHVGDLIQAYEEIKEKRYL